MVLAVTVLSFIVPTASAKDAVPSLIAAVEVIKAPITLAPIGRLRTLASGPQSLLLNQTKSLKIDQHLKEHQK